MSISSKLSSSNFLRQFRNAESRELNKLSAVQFIEVWDHYDNDGKEQFMDDDNDVTALFALNFNFGRHRNVPW